MGLEWNDFCSEQLDFRLPEAMPPNAPESFASQIMMETLIHGKLCTVEGNILKRKWLSLNL